MVLRQAELARGGASSEAGLRINGKTMLTLAECIAHGHGTALFPEGTSHEDSKMRRLRTGPVRSVIAANSIAHEKGLPEPHLLPVGLHYRTSWHFRTDAWFEYGSPISLDGAIHPPEDRARLMAGEWVEAPAERVNQLRDEVRARLAPMTPDSQHGTSIVVGTSSAICKHLQRATISTLGEKKCWLLAKFAMRFAAAIRLYSISSKTRVN